MASGSSSPGGGQRYMTCPQYGDRVPIAEDVSKSLEPGAYLDSMLVAAELDEYRSVLEAELAPRAGSPAGVSHDLADSGRSGDSEGVCERLSSIQLETPPALPGVSESDDSGTSTAAAERRVSSDDTTDSEQWRQRHKHIFVLSESGKPIFSRYGSEEELCTLAGVMQALVSFVQDRGDSLRAVRAGDRTIVFLCRPPLLLVCVCRGPENVAQLTVQLSHMYSQILSVVTQSQLTRISEQRRNFDFRKLLAGAERFLDHLIEAVDSRAVYLLGAVQCLRLEPSARESVTSAIQTVCAKIKDLVFALLISGDRLIALVRIRSHYLHPIDYHIICNIVSSTESFKTVEGWIPICLPKFDASGFMYAYVSTISEACPAQLVLLTADRESFHALALAKAKITEKIDQSGATLHISTAITSGDYLIQDTGALDMRHFMYKCKSTAQSTCPAPGVLYGSPAGARRLYALYHIVHGRIHAPGRPLKTFYYSGSHEIVVGWVSPGFELYTVFEPYISQQTSITEMNRLLRWIKDRERHMFILGSAVF